MLAGLRIFLHNPHQLSKSKELRLQDALPLLKEPVSRPFCEDVLGNQCIYIANIFAISEQSWESDCQLYV